MSKDQTSTSSANDRQVGGSHYQDIVGTCPHCQGKIQHWDLFAMLPYLVGCATKYVTRYALKNGKEDLEKAKHYIDKLIQVCYPAQLDLFPGELERVVTGECIWVNGKPYWDVPPEWVPRVEELRRGGTERSGTQKEATLAAEPVQAAVPLASVASAGPVPVAPIPFRPDTSNPAPVEVKQVDIDQHGYEAARARAEAYALHQPPNRLTRFQARHPEDITDPALKAEFEAATTAYAEWLSDQVPSHGNKTLFVDFYFDIYVRRPIEPAND